MWIFTRYGFYSIACADKPGTKIIDPDTVMVRARVKKHLNNLQDRFTTLADTKILTLQGHDYDFRMLIPKSTWLQILNQLADEQVWRNFKLEAANNVKQTGIDYTRALHEVWGTMYSLQEARSGREWF